MQGSSPLQNAGVKGAGRELICIYASKPGENLEQARLTRRSPVLASMGQIIEKSVINKPNHQSIKSIKYLPKALNQRSDCYNYWQGISLSINQINHLIIHFPVSL